MRASALRPGSAELFPDLPASLPIVIGLTTYGHCVGLTRPWPTGSRISVAPKVFAQGERMVDDVLVHEMVHVVLIAAGQDHKHAGHPWYAAIRRRSPAVLGQDLDMERPRRRSVRTPNPAYGPEDRRRTLVRKVATPRACMRRPLGGLSRSVQRTTTSDFRSPCY